MPADPGLRNRAGHTRTAVQLSPESQASSQTQRPPQGPELRHGAAQETSHWAHACTSTRWAFYTCVESLWKDTHTHKCLPQGGAGRSAARTDFAVSCFLCPWNRALLAGVTYSINKCNEDQQ